MVLYGSHDFLCPISISEWEPRMCNVWTATQGSSPLRSTSDRLSHDNTCRLQDLFFGIKPVMDSLINLALLFNSTLPLYTWQHLHGRRVEGCLRKKEERNKIIIPRIFSLFFVLSSAASLALFLDTPPCWNPKVIAAHLWMATYRWAPCYPIN